MQSLYKSKTIPQHENFNLVKEIMAVGELKNYSETAMVSKMGQKIVQIWGLN